ncbi:MAG: hypothetical protein AAGG50_03845 [Bacteroidota bacterium]
MPRTSPAPRYSASDFVHALIARDLARLPKLVADLRSAKELRALPEGEREVLLSVLASPDLQSASRLADRVSAVVGS